MLHGIRYFAPRGKIIYIHFRDVDDTRWGHRGRAYAKAPKTRFTQ